MNQETIFVQTDPAFNVVLQSLKELRDQNRLQVTYFKTASLKDIESDDDDEDRRFMFGGELEACTNSKFGQTASAVIRMCMLEAASVKRGFWPRASPNTNRRNKAKLQPVVVRQAQPPFCLANNKNAARLYWSKYDQLYPHFRIEHEVSQVALNTQVSMPSMMLIFRANFTEVVEITTTFTATPREEQQFGSYIHVACIVRKITESTEERADGEFTKQLKKMMEPVQIGVAHFKRMTEVKKGDDLKGLLDDLSTFKLEDEKE